ncbi:MAG: 16S rRNA (guanine(527)-N(7))-methyltransferase RsmG [Mycoplasmataceae bacterium]|nr:16S rRNA (guanine(527)-N(7))-methyltransferase RsmG [Mycoplasmataceae bacterium]
MNKEQFEEKIKKTFLNFSNDFFSNIEKYKQYLQKVNKVMNLTRLDSEEKIYEQYFFDSLKPFENIDFFSSSISLLDIGSGSGIPGIVLKILYPEIKLTILETSLKKINFMKELCDILNIKVTFWNQRAEKIEKKQRESFDIVTSRAVAPLKIILEISIAYAKKNGILIEPKGINFQKELSEASVFIKNSKLLLENNNNDTSVLIFKKTVVTDMKIPRAWNKIISN